MGIVCVVRPRPEDAAAALELSQTAGCAVEAIVFVRGSRPTSEVPDLARRLAETSRVLVQEGVSVTCGVEDASRAMPDDLQRLVRTSLHAGATRVAIADTAGCATPWSAEAVVRFVREEIVGPRRPVGIDWRGRNALGLAVANALGAIFGGADRIHVTATGIGRGAGNASAEEMVAVLDSLGVHRWNLAQVPEYTATVSQIFRRPATAAVSAGRSKGARG
jgi:2-isopropylmalate synthase